MSGQLMLWDRRDLKKVKYAASLPRKHGALISLSVHPHRNHIFATGTETGTVAIWDIRNRSNNNNNNDKEYRLFAGHSEFTLINDIKFIGNTIDHEINGIVTCGNDGETQIFQSESGNGDFWKELSQSTWNHAITTIQQEKYPVSSLDFYEQLGIVATACHAQKINFFPI